MYFLSLVLTALNIFCIFGPFLFLYVMYMTGNLTVEMVIPAAIIFVVNIPLYSAITKMRQKARMARKYDKYGRMKQLSQYEKLSVKEQKEIDKQRMRDMERLLPSTFLKEITKKGSLTPEADMEGLIGMENIKQKVAEMEARMEMERKNKKGGTTLSKHMVFFGPPGTGKTTVAAVMTAYLKRYGFIQDNRFLQVNGSFLTGQESAKKMDALVQRAFGGVLFIDEAYAMLQGGYGDEAISALLSQMEDNRDKFVLILAGYKEEMKDLLRSNPGFMSRIAEFFYFEDYTENELLQIFKGMAKKEGYTVDKGGEESFLVAIRKAMREYSFGNARTCRVILDKSISRHCLNIKRSGERDQYVLGSNDVFYEGNPLNN